MSCRYYYYYIYFPVFYIQHANNEQLFFLMAENSVLLVVPPHLLPRHQKRRQPMLSLQQNSLAIIIIITETRPAVIHSLQFNWTRVLPPIPPLHHFHLELHQIQIPSHFQFLLATIVTKLPPRIMMLPPRHHYCHLPQNQRIIMRKLLRRLI